MLISDSLSKILAGENADRTLQESTEKSLDGSRLSSQLGVVHCCRSFLCHSELQYHYIIDYIIMTSFNQSASELHNHYIIPSSESVAIQDQMRLS